MGFDGFLVPDALKPLIGWVVGMDWPEGDEAKCFRLADACAASARQVAAGASGAGAAGWRGGDDWDGEALRAFAEHVGKVTGGRRAEAVRRLVAAALELNATGVQIEYVKRMIEVSVWLLVVQIAWLARVAVVSGGAALALVAARAQLTRLTIRQIAVRGVWNIGLFGGLLGGMDLGVQASQSRRDAIDWGQVGVSALTGAATGGLYTGLAGGLSRLSTRGLQAGMARAEMSAFERVLAGSTTSMWGLMGQAAVANGAVTAASLGLSGDFDWELVLKGLVSGGLGGAEAHWAGLTPTGRAPDAGGSTGDGGGPSPLGGGDGGGPSPLQSGDGGGGPSPRRAADFERSGWSEPSGLNGAENVHPVDPAGVSGAGRQTQGFLVGEAAVTGLAGALPDSAAHIADGGVAREGLTGAVGAVNRSDVATSQFGVSHAENPASGRPASDGPARVVPDRAAAQPAASRMEPNPASGRPAPDGSTPRAAVPESEARAAPGSAAQQHAGGPGATARAEASSSVVHADAPAPTRQPTVDELINRADNPADRSGAAPHRGQTSELVAVDPTRLLTLRDPDRLATSVETGVVNREPLGVGGETISAERLTLGDGTHAVRKELSGRDRLDREHLASRLGRDIGADVPATHPLDDSVILIDWVDGDAPSIRPDPERRWDAPLHNSPEGILLGLLDVLTGNHDRAGGYVVSEEGRLRGFDHDKAFSGALPDTRNPFVRNFADEVGPMGFKWVDNPLSPRDVEIIGAQIRALKDEFVALGREDWYANAEFMFGKVAEHAVGTTSILDSLQNTSTIHSAFMDVDSSQPISYARDPEAFERAYGEAADRFSQGEKVAEIIPYMMDNATDGLGAREGGRGFGVELEFALPEIPRSDWPRVVESIARELHAAGLAEDAGVYAHHQSGKGYERGWWMELENHEGVVGEVISPILHDHPRTWQDLALVCETIQRHGGEVNTHVGGHVHVGMPGYGTSVVKHLRLLELYRAYEDVLFRLAQNPTAENGLHRPYLFCMPNQQPAVPPSTPLALQLSSGQTAVGFRGVEGLNSDHVEFRMWDGTLEPAIIQAQVKLSLALTDAVTRDLGVLPGPERLGWHDEMARKGLITMGEGTTSFRNMVDMLFSRTTDKEQMTALLAITQWQHSLERTVSRTYER